MEHFDPLMWVIKNPATRLLKICPFKERLLWVDVTCCMYGWSRGASTHGGSAGEGQGAVARAYFLELTLAAAAQVLDCAAKPCSELARLLIEDAARTEELQLWGNPLLLRVTRR